MRGTYCLILSCKKDFSTPVGKLGILNFSEGGYIYIGSALNGLSNRLARHLRKKKKLYWHIDYLLESSYLDIDHIFYQSSAVKKECPTQTAPAEATFFILRKKRGHMFSGYWAVPATG